MRDLSHRRLRRAISRDADGELDARTAQALAAHLLECDACSHDLAMVLAIKGSLRRLATAEPPTLAATRLRRWAANLQGLREVPSPELWDRVRHVGGATSDRPGRVRMPVGQAGRNRIRVWFGALVGVVAAVAATGALLFHRPGPSTDPAPVAAVVELARLEPPTSTAAANGERSGPRAGHMLELGDQKVWLARHLFDGREVLVATSDRAFPMPADARSLGTERDAPWRAMRGDLGVACLSQPTHMLLVGHLPAERLVDIGRQLGPF
jgi:anti-sigma factor RsiW